MGLTMQNPIRRETYGSARNGPAGNPITKEDRCIMSKRKESSPT